MALKGETRSRVRRPGRRRATTAGYRRAAQRRLRTFKQATVLAVGLTGLLVLAGGSGGAAEAAQAEAGQVQADTVAAPAVVVDSAEAPGALGAQAAADTTAGDTAADPGRSAQEATRTLRGLAHDLYAALPKIGIALALLLLAGLLARLLGFALRGALGSYERGQAFGALLSILIWLIALGAALSVLAGDARALVGSVGLFGLALSWALQAPIESFTGWLLNSFRGYYRRGDRIAVGDVFGDVYRIDVLTTTVWEAGWPEQPTRGMQGTGALITFPNSEVLRSNILNYTRDFPYIWDELTFGFANESDLQAVLDLVAEAAESVLGERMVEAAERYIALLRSEGVAMEVASHPQVFLSPADSWTNATVRYIVPARERRVWATRLLMEVSRLQGAAEYTGKVVTAYPVSRVEQRVRGLEG